jgi:hypothetical protein
MLDVYIFLAFLYTFRVTCIHSEHNNQIESQLPRLNVYNRKRYLFVRGVYD